MGPTRAYVRLDRCSRCSVWQQEGLGIADRWAPLLAHGVSSGASRQWVTRLCDGDDPGPWRATAWKLDSGVARVDTASVSSGQSGSCSVEGITTTSSIINIELHAY